MGELKRIKEWGDSGDVTCIRCGRVFTLWYNGGELDQKECCGLIYRTEYTVDPDLVICEYSRQDGSSIVF